MTLEELSNLQVSNIIANTSELKSLVKQCLSVVETSTAKDDEIVMWISAAIEDLVRNQIDVESNLSNGLIQGAIVMYVKANFGNGEQEEKDRCERTYKQTLTNLSLSQKFLLEEIEWYTHHAH